MEFEWDKKKAAANQRKHGVTFEEAKTVFSDPKMRLSFDDEHSFTEERYMALGMSNRGRLLLVSHVYLQQEMGVPFERVRIISSRRATRIQENDYA